MNNTELIKTFYNSFAKGNVEEMIDCYHDNIVFNDPAFGTLQGVRAMNMWRMLLSEKSSNAIIKVDKILATNNEGSASWVATYNYGE